MIFYLQSSPGYLLLVFGSESLSNTAVGRQMPGSRIFVMEIVDSNRSGLECGGI